MKQSIKIKIADREYPLMVSSPEQVEAIRKAASELNKKLSLYQDKYPNKGMIEILSVVALNVSVSNVVLQKQIDMLHEGEDNLAKELKSYLENIDKNSR